MVPIQKFKIFLKGVDKSDSVYSYERIGDKYIIVFNNNDQEYTYYARDVEIIESVFNQEAPLNLFEYLYKITYKIDIEKDGTRLDILANHFSKLGFVAKESLLGYYLSGEISDFQNNYNLTQEIYPFGFNSSQKEAINKALKSKISIIEGPPGTGKTQTILNIIANIVSSDMSVAVVSNNNSAIENVLEKLKKYNIDFIAAPLGSNNNKEDFIGNQSSIPDMNDWELEEEMVEELEKELSSQSVELDNKLHKQIELSELKQEYSAINIEEKHFLDIYEKSKPQNSSNFLNKLKSPKDAMLLWLESENFITPNKFWSKVYLLFKFLNKTASRRSFIYKLSQEYSLEFLILEFQKRFYQLKKVELEKQIETISEDLEKFDFSAKMESYSKISLKLLKSRLVQKYKEGRYEEYKKEDLYRASEQFIKDYPVILSTTYSVTSSLSRNVMYDYVIIDESSQVDLCTGVLALSCAKNIIVVGDLKQLQHVVDSKTAEITDSIFEKHELQECYRYKSESLLSSLIKLFPEVPRTLLREHYRCHPKIIEFCNKKFYDNNLIILTEDKGETEPLLVYKTVKGNHARGNVNQRQIDVINNEIIPEQNLNVNDGSLGIVTPYRNQTNVLQDSFKGLNVKADTVDKFQGQEKDVIILSTVDNVISEFTDNANRLNVAVSRAAKQLMLVVNEEELGDGNIADLVNYIDYNNFSFVNSKISSVFDYLFKSYTKNREEFFKGKRKVSNFDSENLFYYALIDNSKWKSRNDLNVALHVPLRMIIRDSSLLSSEEEGFVMHPNSHVDFLIYDSVGKRPKCAIEVDGVAFHKDSGRQAERDKMKNKIFKKYELPLHRFRTDESGEEKRIVDILESI